MTVCKLCCVAGQAGGGLRLMTREGRSRDASHLGSALLGRMAGCCGCQVQALNLFLYMCYSSSGRMWASHLSPHPVSCSWTSPRQVWPTCIPTNFGHSKILTLSPVCADFVPPQKRHALTLGRGTGHDNTWQLLWKHVGHLKPAPLSSISHGLLYLQAWTRSQPLRQVAFAYCQQCWSLLLPCC